MSLIWVLLFALFPSRSLEANLENPIKCFECRDFVTEQGSLCSPTTEVGGIVSSHRGKSSPCPAHNASVRPPGVAEDTPYTCFILKQQYESTGRIEISKGCVAMPLGFLMDNTVNPAIPILPPNCTAYGKGILCMCDDKDDCNEKELDYKTPTGKIVKIGQEDIEQEKQRRRNSGEEIKSGRFLILLLTFLTFLESLRIVI